MTDPESEEVKPKIPLEARMSFIDRAQSNTVWINAKAIAEDIGIYDRWVYRTVKDLGIQSEIKVADGVEVAMYPPWTVDVLREELRWREHLSELPDELTVGEVAESLGRSYGWTQKTLEASGQQPIRKRGPARYSKQALKELRHISMAVPLDDGWYNLRQLVELTGQDREWIERRIAEAGYEPIERRSALTGRVHEYFPPDSLNLVTRAMTERAAAAGEWMTVSGIAKRIGRNEKWVNGRIHRYQDLCQMRQDDMGVTRIHYPPSVLEELQAESEKIKLLPERGDYLNVHEVARLSGHATEWAEKRLEILGIEPELRKDGKGRAQLSYAPSTVQLLIKYEKENPDHNDETIANSTWEAETAIGSLRSQIKLKQSLRAELARAGAPNNDQERLTITNDLKNLRQQLRRITQRLYELEAKARDDAELGG